MAGGHSFNSFLDYAWTGLDKGKLEDRSAEKDYSGAQSLIARGLVSLKEVLLNAIIWYLLALIPLIYLAINVGWPILVVGGSGMLVTFWYSKAKFNWTHELALGMGVGPLASLSGMFATSANPAWVQGILVGVPAAIIIAFAGLALDEYPDAEANLKKGVKSLAYKVWEFGFSLEVYILSWVMFLFIYQILLIVVGTFKPLTGLSFLMFLPVLASLVFLKKYFKKAAYFIIIFAAIYMILLVIGQVYG
jgi:1,4-dihydroxy-2-naphthoate octaprenyltransferase